jgi:hypothetical protein
MNDDLLKNLVKAQLSATVQTQVLDELNRIRQTKPIVFIRTLLKLARVNGKHFELFARQFELTREELALFALEYGKAVGQTVQETIKELGLDQELSETEKPKEPTADELFTAALEILRIEKSNYTKRDFLHFAKKRIEKYFVKNPKPYTEQQLIEAAKWYNHERNFLLLENQKKQDSKKRGRYRVNVPAKIWEVIQLRLFNNKSPEFARQFKKEVRAKAAELRFARNRENSAK